MRYVPRSAGQARGLAKPDYRAICLVHEEIATLEQLPEDAAEALRIDAVEGQESLDELVSVDRKQQLLIYSAGNSQHR